MPLNCEITFELTWSVNCVICKADKVTSLPIDDAKHYVPVVTLSFQDNAKVL